MRELRRVFAHTRLVTILGPGGAGKTRLATEFARQQASHFADGQVLAELADERDPALVADAIARAAGIRLEAEDAAGTLARALQSRQMLLVVDNCEHVIEAAADLVSRLLVACPRLTVLATSRERLNIEGETAWRLPPLALPEHADTVDAAFAAEAVRLFVDRARSVRPGFDIDADNLAAVVAICRRLEGMPLAIELAAARTTTFSAAEIMARLDDGLALLSGGYRDAEARHRTLRATVDWSYELLDSTERTMFRRLAVFAGPVAADAVEEICGFPPLEPAGVADGLQRLVDTSMLQVEPGGDGTTRYRLLETIRDHAAAKAVAAGGEAELRDRHLALYLRLSLEMYEASTKRGARREVRRLWAEMADVRRALDWARRDPEVELELLGSLKRIWLIYAPAEALDRLSKALSRGQTRPTRGHVRALWVQAALTGRGGRPELAGISPAELSALSREAGEEVEAATAFLGMAYVAERVLRDLDAAEENLRLAVDVFEQAGYLPDLAMALSSLGGIEMQRGNFDAARPWVDRGLEVALRTEDEYSIAGALYTQGWLEVSCGHLDAARRSFIEALDVVGDTSLLGIAEQVEGIAATLLGADRRRALTLLGAASRVRDDVDTPVSVPWSLWVNPVIAAARDALPEDAADKAWQAGMAMSTVQVLAMARHAPASGPWRRAKKGAGGLSKRELEVARLVASGMTSPAIAERLVLSERTVESHLEHILTKLSLHSRTQVASWITEQDSAG